MTREKPTNKVTVADVELSAITETEVIVKDEID